MELIECPTCAATMMSDADTCHSCGSRFDGTRAVIEELPSLASEVDHYMEKCRACGEPVRQGLIRCWNCNVFTDPEAERKYRESHEKKKE